LAAPSEFESSLLRGIHRSVIAKLAAEGFDDSQEDSQQDGQRWTTTYTDGILSRETERRWTLSDEHGQPPRGLQNRLKGAVEVSLVGSIPIHPRQPFVAMTAKVTATSADVSTLLRTSLDVIARYPGNQPVGFNKYVERFNGP
jgi:hypothetical protein